MSIEEMLIYTELFLFDECNKCHTELYTFMQSIYKFLKKEEKKNVM